MNKNGTQIGALANENRTQIFMINMISLFSLRPLRLCGLFSEEIV
jgi:hypothetical protein